MKNIALEYRKYFMNRSYLVSFSISLFVFIVAVIANTYSGLYATESMGNYVSDIILDNTPIVDVGFVFVYGSVIFWVFAILYLIKEPKHIPFVFESIAVFIIIRSFFVSLTHFGPFPGAAEINYTSEFLKSFISGGDYFFSGHTGLPFLMALVFHQNKRLFIFFTLSAIFFGIMALLGHLHYSIDVLSAFFITYTIYKITEKLFPEDRKLFYAGIVSE